MNIEPGDEIEIQPFKYGKEGDAIASYNDETVIVKGGKIGETYKLEISHINQGILFTEIVPNAPKEGDIVVDQEREDEEHLVVINRSNMRIKDWERSDGNTVAEKNPDYNMETKNINVVPLDMMEEEMPEWRELNPSKLYLEVRNNEEVHWDNYPEHRLKVVEQREEVMD